MASGSEEIEREVLGAWAVIDRYSEGLVAFLPRLVIGTIIFLLFLLSAKLFGAAIRRIFRQRGGPLPLVLARLSQWGIGFLGLLVGITVMAPSVRPVDLLSLLGIGGVAIGFAFKDILQNFLAGVLILLRQPFRIGDQIVFNSYEGTVEDIATRATHVRTYDGRRVIIPNGAIFTSAVVVNTAFRARRSEHDIGIGYGDDIRAAVDTIRTAMREVSGVLVEPPVQVLAHGFGPSEVLIRAMWWTEPEQATVLAVRDQVISAIRARLIAAGIDQPFPTQTVLFHDQTDATDGDRTRQREGWPAGQQPPPSRTIAGSLIAREKQMEPNGPGAADVHQ